jgi:hypothetical protein
LKLAVRFHGLMSKGGETRLDVSAGVNYGASWGPARADKSVVLDDSDFDVLDINDTVVLDGGLLQPDMFLKVYLSTFVNANNQSALGQSESFAESNFATRPKSSA